MTTNFHVKIRHNLWVNINHVIFFKYDEKESILTIFVGETDYVVSYDDLPAHLRDYLGI